MSRHPLTDARGFTLLEALIAAVVVTVALVSLAELLAVTVRQHQLGRNTTTAARLAQDKLEELIKMDFATHPGLQISGSDTLASNVANYFDVPPNTGYTRRWLVQPGPHAGVRVVTVRIVPDNPDGRVGGPYTLSMLVRAWQ